MSDRNLLFVVLALQNQLVRKSDALTAMNIWISAKQRPIADIIVECGMMRPDDRQLLDVLIDRQIARHGSVEDSLAALDMSSGIQHFLNSLADPDVQASLAHVGAAANGERTGPLQPPTGAGLRYRVLRPHAKGGLGEVFVAEDTEVHRHVALKEMQERHAADPASCARFQLEAEITGRLEHPGVVPVYGLGQYADGRPFYAMRFIKGDNLKDAITRFYEAEQTGRDAGEQRLAFRQLLRRFIDVCNAVAYAHSRGVLHRDIKPGNIMLGKYGETLVVDWGLAKVAGRSLARSASEEPSDETTLRPTSGSNEYATIPGVAFGTPAFMSPEQAAGKLDELGPASDIYSLGATLYVLLTSQVPFDEQEIGPLLQKVQHGDFPTPRQIRPGIPPALHSICLKAMALKPNDRYASALDLAADVEHWLADEPVTAYPEPWRERARRWMRRHRTLMTSAAAVLVMAVWVLGGAALLLNAAREREKRALLEEGKQRAEAENAKEHATAVAGFLIEAFRKPDPERDGKEVRVVDVLETAIKELENEESYTAQMKGGLLDAIGQTYMNLGILARSVELLEQAKNHRYESLGPDHWGTLSTMSTLAQAYQHAGRLTEALQLHEETLKRRSAKLGPDHDDTIRSMNNLGWAYLAVGRISDAVAMLEGAFRRRVVISGETDAEAISSMGNLASAYKAAGRSVESMQLAERALTLAQEKFGPVHPRTLTCLNNLADTYHEIGRTGDAQRLFEQARTQFSTMLGVDHPSTLTLTGNVAYSYLSSGRVSEAVALYEELLGITETKLGHDHPSTLLIMGNLGRAYRLAERLDDALRLARETLKLHREKLGSDHPNTLTSMERLAHVYSDAGRFQDALLLHEEKYRRSKAKFGLDHESTLVAMNGIASNYHRLGKDSDALTLLKETFARMKATLGADHRHTLNTMGKLAGAYLSVGCLDESLPLRQEALRLCEGKFGRDHPDTVQARHALADLYLLSERYREAMPLYAALLTLQRPKLPVDSINLAQILLNHGECLLNEGRYDNAEQHLREALLIRGKKIPNDWRRFSAEALLGAALAGQKRHEAAERLLLAGYEGLEEREKTIPSRSQRVLFNALDRIIHVYDDWEKPDKAAEWRAKREERKQAAERMQCLRLAVIIVAGWPMVR